VFAFDDGSTFSVGRYDGWVKLSTLEQAFARALDEADFVHWWHRNRIKSPTRSALCGLSTTTTSIPISWSVCHMRPVKHPCSVC
jgi:hypothetical protein